MGPRRVGVAHQQVVQQQWVMAARFAAARPLSQGCVKDHGTLQIEEHRMDATYPTLTPHAEVRRRLDVHFLLFGGQRPVVRARQHYTCPRPLTAAPARQFKFFHVFPLSNIHSSRVGGLRRACGVFARSLRELAHALFGSKCFCLSRCAVPCAVFPVSFVPYIYVQMY